MPDLPFLRIHHVNVVIWLSDCCCSDANDADDCDSDSGADADGADAAQHDDSWYPWSVTFSFTERELKIKTNKKAEFLLCFHVIL